MLTSRFEVWVCVFVVGVFLFAFCGFGMCVGGFFVRLFVCF